ncbi:MAG: glycosyltransferase [Hadesarchaea archaeon]|nr:glycosyltransferase [Hadesarchaea archaeon]
MRVAVCHDLLNVRGGAERVVLTLSRAFKADLFVLLYEPEKTFEEAGKVRVHALGAPPLPSDRRFYPWVYPLFHSLGMWRFLTLGLEGYEVVITSGKLGVFARGRRTLHYCHSPPRFLYDLRPFILRHLQKLHGRHARLLAEGWWRIWRRLDGWAASRPDLLVANSRTVQERIRRYYGRSSVVVYPPVEVGKFKVREGGDYFLAVERPSPEKGIELLLEIFRRVPEERLVWVGDYLDLPYLERLERRVRRMKNVTWLRGVGEEELRELYAGCKAVLHTARDEDFGMVPVEAMASGKPVIAVNEGGVRETVIQGETGMLVEPPFLPNFVRAIKTFDPSLFSPWRCRRRAEEFSRERFVRRMRALVRELVGN